jgi:hydroxymethylbilane synthase
VAVVAAAEGPWKIEPAGIAVAGKPFNFRPAGIGEAKQLGNLVESLAQGVIDRRSIAAIAANIGDSEKLGVTPGNQEEKIWRPKTTGQPRGEGMALEMIDRNERQAGRQSDGLGRAHANEHARKQPRSGGCCDAVEIRNPALCLRESTGDQSVQVGNMGPGGNFGNDATVRRMLGQLREHAIGQDAAAAYRGAADNGGGSLVAGGLDTENGERGGVIHVAIYLAAPVRKPVILAGKTGPNIPICSMQISRLRIGSRGSKLALVQAEEVKARLVSALGMESEGIEIVSIVTTGDRIRDRSLSEIGGKGLFTKEIEEALLGRTIDLAVHSMKDLPAVLPEGLVIGGMLVREDPRDAFLSPISKSIEALPRGARIGSSSIRRAAQLRRRRPDLTFSDFRGNVDTRLRKLKAGEVDATLLACAGLNRLGLHNEITARIEVEDMLPALGQGAIGIEIRREDGPMAEAIAMINDEATAQAVACERGFLAELDGSCKTPIAGYARVSGGRLYFQGETLTPDGREAFTASREGLPGEAWALGLDAGLEVKRRGGHLVL